MGMFRGVVVARMMLMASSNSLGLPSKMVADGGVSLGLV
jgi:hypothetical protein